MAQWLRALAPRYRGSPGVVLVKTVLLFLAFTATAVGCAHQSERDLEPFDSRQGLAIELPPTDSSRPERAHVERSPHRSRLAEGVTLEEAQQIALETNPGLLANGDAVDAAKARIDEVAALTNPVFSFGKGELPTRGYSVNDNPPRPTLTSDTGVRSFDAWDFRASSTAFSLQKDFDVSGKRVARVDNAIENERQSEAQYASAALQLKAQVRVAYATILVAEQNLDLVREARDMASRNLQIVGSRARGGDALPSDNERAEADAKRAEIDFAQAERDVLRARRVFATLLGDPMATIGPLRGELPLSEPPTLEEEPLIAVALERNADVVAAKRAVLAAQANLRLQDRTAFPDVTVQANYNRYILDRLDTVGFNISLPLPVFDRNRGQVAEATANLHQAEQLETSTEQAVLQGVRDDLHVLRISQLRIKVFRDEILPHDRTAVRLSTLGYEIGKTLYLDVIAVRQAFNQARADYATELMNYETTLADLERLMGVQTAGARAP